MIPVTNIPLESIYIEERARKDLGKNSRIESETLESLVISIKDKGLISPIAVEKMSDGRYLLLAGERRLTACELLEWKDIPVRIYEGLNQIDRGAIELAENIYRKDMTWDEQVLLKKKIHEHQIAIYGEWKNKDQGGWTGEKTAAMLGESKSSLYDDLGLAEALEAIPELRKFRTKDEVVKTLKALEKDVRRDKAVAEFKAKKVSTSEDLQKRHLIDCYNISDYFDWVRRQPSDTYDMAEIDPPYGVDLINAKMSDESVDSILHSAADYTDVPADEYVAFITSVLTETFRILKPDSWLILWFGWRWFPEVFQAARVAGFIGNNIPLIWTKGQGQTKQPNLYMGSAHEPAFYLRKGNPKLNKPGRLNTFDYSTISPQHKVHPTERPIDMMTDLLSTFVMPNSKIVSPFLGSGNTILAANNINCECEGCDLSQVYKDSFIVKVDNGTIGDFNSLRRKE